MTVGAGGLKLQGGSAVPGTAADVDELRYGGTEVGNAAALVGQLLLDGCVVYPSHPMVAVPKYVSCKSGAGIPPQSNRAMRQVLR